MTDDTGGDTPLTAADHDLAEQRYCRERALHMIANRQYEKLDGDELATWLQGERAAVRGARAHADRITREAVEGMRELINDQAAKLRELRTQLSALRAMFDERIAYWRSPRGSAIEQPAKDRCADELEAILEQWP